MVESVPEEVRLPMEVVGTLTFERQYDGVGWSLDLEAVNEVQIHSECPYLDFESAVKAALELCEGQGWLPVLAFGKLFAMDERVPPEFIYVEERAAPDRIYGKGGKISWELVVSNWKKV